MWLKTSPAATDHGHEVMLNPRPSHRVHRFGTNPIKGSILANEPKMCWYFKVLPRR